MPFGEILRFVALLILAVVAIVLIWYFHEKLFVFFSDILLEGLKNFVCSLIPGWIPGAC